MRGCAVRLFAVRLVGHLAALAILSSSLVGCDSDEQNVGSGEQQTDPEAAPLVGVLVSRQTHRFKESSAAMRNPGKGWLAYIFNTDNPSAVDDTPLASAYYTNNLSWGDLEPERGRFDWTRIERLVRFSQARGKKLRLALNSVDPTTRSLTYRPQIPAWFIHANPSAGRWIGSYYGVAIDPANVNPYNGNAGFIFEPDYASAAYTREYFHFLSALTAHWQATPLWREQIEEFEISNYGLWGEWHSDFPWSSAAVKAVVLRGFVDWYFALLPRMSGTLPKVRLEISALFSAFGDSGVTAAVDKGADMARKCIGICLHGLISESDRQTISRYRPWRALRGEFGSWSGAIEKFYATPTATTPVNDTKGALNEGLNVFKLDLLGWYVGATLSKPSGVGSETYAEYFQKRSGYRFFLESLTYPTEARPGEVVDIGHSWYQRGVSKLYLPAKLAVDLVNGGKRFSLGEVAFDAVNWPLGAQGPKRLTSRFKVPVGIPPGRYSVSVALVDDLRRPMINLASDGKETSDVHAYSFYRAGWIEIRP